MSREREYRQLADDMFQRANNEECAELVAQWKILGARYLELAKQSGDRSDDDVMCDPIQGELSEGD